MFALYFNRRGNVTKIQAGKNLCRIYVTNFFNFWITNF